MGGGATRLPSLRFATRDALHPLGSTHTFFSHGGTDGRPRESLPFLHSYDVHLHQYQYFTLRIPNISDAEYDALFRALRHRLYLETTI